MRAHDGGAYTRRGLLRVAGGGLLVAGVASRSAQAAAPTRTTVNVAAPAKTPAQVAAPVKAAAPASAKPGNVLTARPMPKLDRPLGEPPEGRVGYAVVGLGQFALAQILPAFAECRRSRLAALVSGDPQKARSVARAYGLPETACRTYDRLEQLREDPSVQVVYVITPNSLHADLTIRAARAGKHVLCEKPLATSSADCRRMIDACKAAGVQLMTAYRAHFEPHNVEAIRIARSGELGKLVSIVADHGRTIDPSKPADQWRLQKALAGGGPLPDVGIYSLNACRYLTGEEPIEVSAMLHQPRDDPRFREVEQAVHWTLRFPSGVLANCSTSYDYHESKRYRVLAQKGWIELDPATSYTGNRMQVERPAKGEGPGHREAVREELRLADASQFALMIDHFSECVKSGKTPRTPGEEGLRDVRLIESIYEAARTGRTIKLT